MQRSLDSFFGASKRAVATAPDAAAKKARLGADAAPAPGAVSADADATLKVEGATPEATPAPASPAAASPGAASPAVDAPAQNAAKLGDAAPGGAPAPGPVEYLTLTTAFAKMEATTKRLEILHHCTTLFDDVLRSDPSTLLQVTYLCINRLGPDYEGLELGLGESIIMKALGESTGRAPAQVKKEYQKVGDLGTVALLSKRNQATMLRPKPLTVPHVFAKLTEVARSTGQQSQAKKIGIIKGLLVACRETEAKYLVRSLEGKLRIGLAETSVLAALAQALAAHDARAGRAVVAPDVAQALVKDAFHQMPNYEVLLAAALEHGVAELPDRVRLEPGVPLKPMLAKPTKSISEVLDRFQDEQFTCEYKYDGERAQIHCAADGKISVFSRNQENMSGRYPDIVDIIPRIRTDQTRDFILDCEAVAWDREQQKILPFQILSTRKRKDVDLASVKIRVQLYVFDILYLNGESQLTKPLSERRELIKSHFNIIPGEFVPAVSMDTDSIDAIQEFLDQSVKDSCEGLMIKMLHGDKSGYEPSKRSRNWLKLKKDYLDGVGDSIDLAVIGVFYGRGKRTNWYGSFLLGSYNADTEMYESVCKISTGFSEADLERFYKEFSPLVDEKPKSYISHDPAANQQPDLWLEPRVVWEVLTADLSLSPVYRAGSEELGKGVSLRFPRFIRERPDKGPEDSTSAEQLVQLYRKQAAVQSGRPAADDFD